MSARNILIAGVLALLVSGCGTGGTVAGKSGGDQTENGLQAQVLDVSGAPVGGARVRVRPADWLRTGATDSTGFSGMDARTDSTGEFRILALPSGNYRVEVILDGKALQFGVRIGVRFLDAGTHQLSPMGSVQGRVSTPAGTLVGVQGLDHSTRSDSSGRFRLDSLPTGVSKVLTGDGSYAWTSVISQSTAGAGLLRRDSAGEVLLDDFEDGDTQNRWGPVTGGGWWFASTSDTSIRITPSGLPSNPILGVTATTTSHGEVFHAAFSVPAGLTNPWAEVGVGLGNSPANLSALTAISFQAQGSGIVAVLITSNNGGRLAAYTTLPSTWSEVRIPLDSFKVHPYTSGANVPVSTLLASANGLGWEFTATGEIWLDDIRLIGPTPQSIWGAIQVP